jgi:NhaA family Na+:H+ antiporter
MTETSKMSTPPPAAPGPGDAQPAARKRLWSVPSDHEGSFIAAALRQETVGGFLLLAAAIVALIWANSPWDDAYESMLHFDIGPLNLEHWAADGGLAVFFFLAGLELKRELVLGSLSNPADALVPAAAAVCGMLVPACIYLAIASAGDASLDGWAVPMATDIAFALAVLAVVGSALPASLRAFLLTLAVVDDLGAILVIATVFTDTIDYEPLVGAIVLMALYAFLQRKRVTTWLVYVPLALACWWLVYESGVHATIAGVALGLLTRVRPDPDESESPAERLEHRIRPISAGLAVPFFALMSAGVAIGGGQELIKDPIVLGIVFGLVVGKTIGVLTGAWTATRLTRAELAPEISWRDVFGVAVLSGIGFTVSLLIADLAFTGTEAEHAKTAVLVGSVLAGGIAAVLLRRRNRHHQSRSPA